MGLVPAKCTQCGANIDVDDTKDAGICGNCGTLFVTEKVIHNHITNHYATTNIHNHGTVIMMGNSFEKEKKSVRFC